MTRLTEHFTVEEMRCRCGCGECLVRPELMQALEELRSKGPEPIIVNDGYRCKRHNAEVGGVPLSEHPRGIAADLEIKGLTLQQMYDRAKLVPNFLKGGIGVYDGGFIHVDIRGTFEYSGSAIARWARVRGKYVGISALVKE